MGACIYDVMSALSGGGGEGGSPKATKLPDFCVARGRGSIIMEILGTSHVPLIILHVSNIFVIILLSIILSIFFITDCITKLFICSFNSVSGRAGLY